MTRLKLAMTMLLSDRDRRQRRYDRFHQVLNTRSVQPRKYQIAKREATKSSCRPKPRGKHTWLGETASIRPKPNSNPRGLAHRGSRRHDQLARQPALAPVGQAQPWRVRVRRRPDVGAPSVQGDARSLR